MIIARLREKIAQLGLENVVAARLRVEGYKFAELNLRTLAEILGQKIYEKNADYRRIVDGIHALHELQAR